MAEFPSGTVTFLFSDLEGSTALFERHPLAMQSVLARHDELLRAAVEGHDGHVVKFTGDGVHAVFASASCAIDAAIAVQRSMASEAWPHDIDLRVRIGVHTGESVYRDGDYFGSEVNRAARIMSVAHGGQIVRSATGALVHDVEIIDLGEHRLRDLRSQVSLVQVIAPALQTSFPHLRSLDAAR